MIDLSIGEGADVLGAQIKGDVGLVATLAFPSVSIDSRTNQKGECFIAFEGERFNGHNFIDEALEKGASVVVLSQNSAVHSNWQDRLFLEVNDTEIALQALAHYVRRKWGKSLAAISGKIISKMIANENTNLDLEPYNSKRFS